MKKGLSGDQWQPEARDSRSSRTPAGSRHPVARQGLGHARTEDSPSFLDRFRPPERGAERCYGFFRGHLCLVTKLRLFTRRRTKPSRPSRSFGCNLSAACLATSHPQNAPFSALQLPTCYLFLAFLSWKTTKFCGFLPCDAMITYHRTARFGRENRFEKRQVCFMQS